MKNSFRLLAEAEILDRAAALLARRGFDKTSVQDVAGAVGLSKTGLLHHYPSKDALYAAVRAHAEGLADEVLEQVRTLPLGRARDARAVEVLVDVALRHPGTVALMLAPASDLSPAGSVAEVEHTTTAVLQAFGLDVDAAGTPVSPHGPERAVRVVGALAALAVLTLAAHRAGTTTAWRPLIVATCLDALGHGPDESARPVPGSAAHAPPDVTPHPAPDVTPHPTPDLREA